MWRGGGRPGPGLFPAGLDLADEFRRKAEVGGDHVLGDTLDEMGKGIVEMMIAFFPGEGVDEKEVLLGGGKGPLDDKPEIPV